MLPILRILALIGLSAIIYLIGTERDTFRKTDIGNTTLTLVISTTIGLIILIGTS